MANEVFISYSRKDFKKVREIKATLDREVGIDCWMDLDGIESGEQFEDVIIDAICRHDTVLFMKSAQSMESEWALDELDFAKHEKKRIVIVHIDDSEMTRKFYFRYHKYDQIDWNNSLQCDKLIRNLKSWFSKVQDSNVFQKKETQEVCDIEDTETCPPNTNDYLKGEIHSETEGKAEGETILKVKEKVEEYNLNANVYEKRRFAFREDVYKFIAPYLHCSSKNDYISNDKIPQILFDDLYSMYGIKISYDILGNVTHRVRSIVDMIWEIYLEYRKSERI